MTVLVVLIPPRPRLHLRDDRDGAAPPPTVDWTWHLLDGSGAPQRAGQGPISTWPAATRLVLVLAPQDLAWHRVTLPKAPAGRMRQALLGVLEDQLLGEDTDLHFALAPEPVAGQPTWVAVTSRPRLAGLLQHIEAAGRPVDRVLPSMAPAAPPTGHFERDPSADDDAIHLIWADAQGVLRLGLAGSLARARVAAADDARFSAAPAAAAAAEAWLGRPVTVLSDGERAQQAQQAPWNLRQFDLAPRHRGAGAARGAWRRFLSPAWRAVHVGLAALVVINLLGLNAWAWMQERALSDRKQAMLELLRSTHPQVRAVLDAPLQMARETERLRAAAGQPGDADLETLLGVAAAAWPEANAPASSLRFEPGRLSFGIDDWDDAQIAAFRERLAPAGWATSHDGDTVTLARADPSTPAGTR